MVLEWAVALMRSVLPSNHLLFDPQSHLDTLGCLYIGSSPRLWEQVHVAGAGSGFIPFYEIPQSLEHCLLLDPGETGTGSTSPGE